MSAERLYNVYRGSDCGWDVHTFSQFLMDLKGKGLINIDLNKQSINALFAYANSSSSDVLSYSDFSGWFTPRVRSSTIENIELLQKAYMLFEKYDCKTKKGLLLFLEELETPHHKDNVFGILDKDKNGFLSFKEFCDWLGWLEK